MASLNELTCISIECVDNVNGDPDVVVYGDRTFAISSEQISIKCVDNADGVPGVVVYGDRTFALSHEQDTVIEWTASGDGQAPYSSVRPFQIAHYEIEDPAAQDLDPIWTDSNSPASLQEEGTEEDD